MHIMTLSRLLTQQEEMKIIVDFFIKKVSSLKND